ncbi:MAG TPA: Crp/Fnr family transcriptional regulator [Caldilineae bacterium]|nr:Crp/Fnr family transcriptional regulator [Caldilineae bacterium]
MVSPELIRRYPYFAGLSMDQIVTLAKVADEQKVEAGHYFFHEGDELCCFYLVLEGAVAVVIEMPDGQEAVISTAGPGEVFAWSALVPPHTATASVKAMTPCHVVAFDCRELRKAFEEDCRFGYLMMVKAAQVIRDRLVATRLQVLAHTPPAES